MFIYVFVLLLPWFLHIYSDANNAKENLEYIGYKVRYADVKIHKPKHQQLDQQNVAGSLAGSSNSNKVDFKSNSGEEASENAYVLNVELNNYLVISMCKFRWFIWTDLNNLIFSRIFCIIHFSLYHDKT